MSVAPHNPLARIITPPALPAGVTPILQMPTDQPAQPGDSANVTELATWIMRAWRSRRDQTRADSAMSDLVAQYGANSQQVRDANARLVAARAMLRPNLAKIQNAEQLVMSAPLPSLWYPPTMPAEFSNDGFPQSDWARAIDIARTMQQRSLAQIEFGWVTEENAFWRVVNTANVIVEGVTDTLGSPNKLFLYAGLVVGAVVVVMLLRK